MGQRRVEVVVLKTQAQVMSEAAVRNSLQLPLYIRACRQALWLSVSTDVYYFLRHGSTVHVAYSDEELEVRWAQAERIAALIRTGERSPTPGPRSRMCPPGDACPVSTARE